MDKRELINKACSLLDDYGYEYDYSAIKQIIDEWEKSKADLLAHFRQHPNWDEDRLAIVLEAEFLRKFDGKKVTQYAEYIRGKAREWLREREIDMIDGHYVSYWKCQLSASKTYSDYINLLFSKGYSVDEARMENAAKLCEANSIMNQIVYDNVYDMYVSKADWEYYGKWSSIANVITYIGDGDHIITERLKMYFEQCGIEVAVGAKTSRVIRKLLTPYGIFADTERNDRGSLICEQKYAEFADAINPLKVKTTTYISLNPLDYWTMSFGHHWASCHTIDVNNYREELNGEHTYNGCYSSGTESYMLDKSTVIVYTGEMLNKIKRCNFHFSSDGGIIIQGRVYPDARDDGDTTYAAPLRQIVQEVISSVYEIPNNWENKKGTSNCSCYIEESRNKTNYSDYYNYNDCNVSINKGIPEMEARVYIGHAPICPQCGRTHDYQENICCPQCLDGHGEWLGSCDRCGADIYEDNDDYIRAYDGTYFCCADCAEEAGYEYCYDTDDYRDEYFWDDYEDVYYSGEPEVKIESGQSFRSEYNARQMGYEYAEDTGNWWHKDDLFQHSDGLWYEVEEEDDELDIVEDEEVAI